MQDEIDISKLSDDELKEYLNYLDGKITHFDLYQKAMKILINSLYGALGTPSFRYYNVHMAEAITLTGQVMIKYIERCLNEYLGRKLGEVKDYVCAIDTDSVYIVLNDWVNRITKGKPQDYERDKIVDAINKFCESELEPHIDESYERIAQYSNARENKMDMKREVISTSAMWRAKKNYIMHVIDDEHFRHIDPKLKMMGVETARAATPMFVKDALKDVYKILLSGEESELIDYVIKFKQQYYKKTYEEIAFSLGVNDIEKWISFTDERGFVYPKSKTPWHVKASMAFNNGIVRYGLKEITPIISGNKIKLVNISTPNPFNNDVIAYSDYVPEVFEIEQYVDYDAMYKKTFLKPVESFTKLINWQTRKTLNVDSLFK